MMLSAPNATAPPVICHWTGFLLSQLRQERLNWLGLCLGLPTFGETYSVPGLFSCAGIIAHNWARAITAGKAT